MNQEIVDKHGEDRRTVAAFEEPIARMLCMQSDSQCRDVLQIDFKFSLDVVASPCRMVMRKLK
jgi:hypothetical protein